MSSAVLLPLYLVVFGGLLYVFAIRPQRRRQQEVQNLLSALKAGDEIVTVAGIYGTVTEIEAGGTLLIEVAEDTEIRIARGAVASLANAASTDDAPAAPAEQS